MKIRSWIPSTSGTSFLAWSEILLLPPLSLGLAVYLDRQAPFTGGGFPWLWLVPFLLGLRYGLAAGALSSLLLVAGGVAADALALSLESPPLPQIVGGLMAALSAGQFSSNWRARLEEHALRTEYAEERLEALTRAYFVTRISHDRLEEALITQPVTLRGALERLRPLAMRATGGLDAATADDLLQLLAQYCRFETAAIYLSREGAIDPRPLAALGPAAPLVTDDPVVERAREEGQASFYTVDQLLDLDLQTSYRAVFPLRDSTDKMWGLIVVSDMPLLAFNEENLAMANAIILYVTEEIRVMTEGSDLLEKFPCCPPRFAHELIRLHRLRQRAGIRSTLIMLQLPAPGQGQAPSADDIRQGMRRSLDEYWIHPNGGHTPALLVLLPLAGPASARGYLDRLDAWLKQHGHGEGLNAPGYRVKEIPLDDRPVDALLTAAGIACAPQTPPR